MPKMSGERLTKRAVERARPGSYVWDSEVRGFGVRAARERTDGAPGAKSFVFRYSVPAPLEHNPKHRAQHFETLGGFPALTVEQARELARAKAAKGRNEDHRAVREHALQERSRAKTLRELGDYYLDIYAKERGLRPSTVKGAKHLLGLVPNWLMSKLAVQVTSPDVRQLHAKVRDENGGYQANRLVAVLSKMFKLAEENGWRSEPNPCRSVKKCEEEPRWRNLSEDEVARLLDACDAYEAGPERDDPVLARNAADAVRLLLFTGARLQEVLKADWAQFDLERGRWTKPSSHTKTKRQHLLDLDGPALDLLKAMREQDPIGRFLFPGRPREVSSGRWEPRARADLKWPWRWIATAAGLTDKDDPNRVRLHDLRRTTASFMLSGGASLATVGSALGHTQAATTQRYARLSQTVQREELKRAGERMAALRGTSRKADVVTLKRVGSDRASYITKKR